MTPDELKFSANRLVITGIDSFTTDLFDAIPDSETIPYTIGGEVISIEKSEKKKYDERFISFYIEKGDRYPYSDTVYDAAKGIETLNPRKADEFELDREVFVMVDCKKQHIYLSNQKEKGPFEKWLARKLKKEIIIKALLDEGDFLAQIESVKKISLSVDAAPVENGRPVALADALKYDAFGLGARWATLTVGYKKNQPLSAVRKKVEEVLSQNEKYTRVVVTGRDQYGVERIFNTEEIVYKIVTKPTKDATTGKYIPETAFVALMLKIRKQDQE